MRAKEDCQEYDQYDRVELNLLSVAVTLEVIITCIVGVSEISNTGSRTSIYVPVSA